MLDDHELERYSRQLLLDEWSVENQIALKQSHVIIVGLGGLGSLVAPYLAAAGVGYLSLFDDDVIDLSNLQRQIFFGDHQLGSLKIDMLRNHLSRLNCLTKVDTFAKRFDEDVKVKSDCIVDCSDSFATRFAVNRWALKNRTPLISGAAIRFIGQQISFDFRNDQSPCYACVFAEEEGLQESCRQVGVIGPILGLVASWQSMETINILRDVSRRPITTLKQFNFQTGLIKISNIQKDYKCVVCSL